jgi:hypothetical protein
MSVKFKIGFTMDAETLFGLMSKMLPVENLSVEEVFERPSEPMPRLPHKGRGFPGPDLKKGVNGIIMIALAEGPKRAVQIQPKVQAAGFSPNSVNSRLEALYRFGVIERVGDGTWRKK